MRIRGRDKVAGLLEKAKDVILPADGPLLALADRRPVHMEVGCGRGSFIATMAARQPECFFLAVDRYTPIVARAAALAVDLGLANVRYVDADLERLAEGLPASAIAGIYLNFSDPWPRRRNEIKRLTHPRLLSLYRTWLMRTGTLSFKTDNAPFFDWSVRQLEKEGWTLILTERNLSVEPPAGCEADPAFIQTEYERKFRALGSPILYLRAAPPA